MVSALVEVYRSARSRPCRHRALVLTSQGIPFLMLQQEGFHLLLVEEHLAREAEEQLERYALENQGRRGPVSLPPAAPLARLGSLAFALLLVGMAALQWNSALGIDWTARGAAVAGDLRAGQLWRALTALTLHSDLAHLCSNLFFGLGFGYLVAHVHGGGLGWAAILAAGWLGNLTNAWVQPELLHGSIGASTAVFGAAGILCGSEARRRKLLREDRSRWVAPVAVALVLLAFLGLGEPEPGFRLPTVDVLAHVFGLLWGLALGAAMTPRLEPLFLRPRAQQVAAACALGLLVGAWALALR